MQNCMLLRSSKYMSVLASRSLHSCAKGCIPVLGTVLYSHVHNYLEHCPPSRQR